MDYKSKYNRLLATFWIMLLVGAYFFWYMFGTLNRLDKEIQDFKTQQTIQMNMEAGWIPYDHTNRMKETK